MGQGRNSRSPGRESPLHTGRSDCRARRHQHQSLQSKSVHLTGKLCNSLAHLCPPQAWETPECERAPFAGLEVNGSASVQKTKLHEEIPVACVLRPWPWSDSNNSWVRSTQRAWWTRSFHKRKGKTPGPLSDPASVIPPQRSTPSQGSTGWLR